MRRLLSVTAVLVMVSFLTTGCANMTKKQQGFVGGAVAGATIGGFGGAAVGGSDDSDRDRDHGAVIGAVAGAVIGGIIGMMTAKEELPPPPTQPVPVVQPAPKPEPAPAPKPAPAPLPMVKEKIVLRGINFDFDKSNIKPEFAPVLDEAAKILKDRADVKVVIEGHCDAIGTDAYNQKRSERRAKAVLDYLVGKSVSAQRLETVGYGESKPMADNKTKEGRRMNRRVEFKVMN